MTQFHICCQHSERFSSLVDHDFTQHGAEESTEPVGDALRLHGDVSGWQRATALDVKAALQQGVVESTDVATQRRRLARCGQLAGRVVDVDRQLVEVVHEIAVAHTLRICNVATDQTPLPRLSHCASPTGVDEGRCHANIFLSFSDIFLSELDAILLSSDSKFDLSNC